MLKRHAVFIIGMVVFGGCGKVFQIRLAETFRAETQKSWLNKSPLVLY